MEKRQPLEQAMAFKILEMAPKLIPQEKMVFQKKKIGLFNS